MMALAHIASDMTLGTMDLVEKQSQGHPLTPCVRDQPGSRGSSTTKPFTAQPSLPKGPLSVFSANKQWTPPRGIHFKVEEGDLGFTLRGNSPVQVHFLDPHCSASVSGRAHRDWGGVSGLDPSSWGMEFWVWPCQRFDSN